MLKSQQALFALIFVEECRKHFLMPTLDFIRVRTPATAVLTVNYGTHFAHYTLQLLFFMCDPENREEGKLHIQLCVVIFT